VKRLLQISCRLTSSDILARGSHPSLRFLFVDVFGAAVPSPLSHGRTPLLSALQHSLTVSNNYQKHLILLSTMPKKSRRRAAAQTMKENAGRDQQEATSWKDQLLPGPPELKYEFPPEDLFANEEIKRNNVEALKIALEEFSFVDNEGSKWYRLIPSKPGDTGSPKCLGVPPMVGELVPGFQNLVSVVQNSQYAALYRPQTAPGKCRIARDDPRENEVISKFWQGDFSFSFFDPSDPESLGKEHLIISPDTEPEVRKDKFCLRAQATYCNSENDAESCDFCICGPLGDLTGRLDYVIRTDFVSIFHNAQFLRDVTFEEYKQIEARIIHQVLRQYGWMIPGSVLHTMVDLASIPYQKSKKFYVALTDLLIVRTDVMINRPYEDTGEDGNLDIGKAMQKVAGALHTVSKKRGDETTTFFHETFRLNIEITERFFRDYHKSDRGILSYRDASLNALRLSRFEDALDCISRSLLILGTINDIVSHSRFGNQLIIAHIKCLIATLRVLNGVRFMRNRFKQGTKFLPTDDEKVLFGLEALLLHSRLKPKLSDVILGMTWQEKVPLQSLTALKYQHHASKVLAFIFTNSGTWGRMKSAILSTMVNISAPWDPPLFEGFNDTKIEDLLKHARQHLIRNDVHTCNACGKQDGGRFTQKHQACIRCQYFFYCSKDCQKAHWICHKKECKTLSESQIQRAVDFNLKPT
jgi:hypothetical protein